MKYWVYHEGEVPGAYEPHELARMPGFTAASLVCPADASSEQRRWQRAGLYPDIIEALRMHDMQPPPAAPVSAASYADPTAATGPDELLNASSHRIFLHVTELMKELENRREEQALTQSLQRTLVDLKGELHAARERLRFLDDRVSTIPATEERERRALEEAERLRAEIRAFEERLRERDARISQTEQRLQEAALALDNALRGQTDAIREQKRLGQVVEDLNRQLGQKESSLAKSLAMIRRLESELSHLLPPSLTRSVEPPPPGIAAGVRGDAGTRPPNPLPVPAAALPDIPRLSSSGPAQFSAPDTALQQGSRRPAPAAAATAEPRLLQALTPETPVSAEREKPTRPPEVIALSEEPGAPPRPEPGPPPPAAAAAPDTKPAAVTPVPAPWQTALRELTSFLKSRMPGGEPDDKP